MAEAIIDLAKWHPMENAFFMQPLLKYASLFPGVIAPTGIPIFSQLSTFVSSYIHRTQVIEIHVYVLTGYDIQTRRPHRSQNTFIAIVWKYLTFGINSRRSSHKVAIVVWISRSLPLSHPYVVLSLFHFPLSTTTYIYISSYRHTDWSINKSSEYIFLINQNRLFEKFEFFSGIQTNSMTFWVVWVSSIVHVLTRTVLVSVSKSFFGLKYNFSGYFVFLGQEDPILSQAGDRDSCTFLTTLVIYVTFGSIH